MEDSRSTSKRKDVGGGGVIPKRNEFQRLAEKLQLCIKRDVGIASADLN